jgi:O-antigen ligase
MIQSTRNARTTWLSVALSIYAVSTLISMAVMSIGAAVAVLGIVYYFGSLRNLRFAFRGELQYKSGRFYFLAALGLTFACVLSLVVAKACPLVYDGKFSEIHIFKDSLKLWYLFWPLPLAAGLRVLTAEKRETVLRAWIIAFGVLSIVGIFQFWTGWPRPQWIPGTDRHYHATLFLGHHLTVASVLIFPFFVSLDFALRAIKTRKPVIGFGSSVWILLVLAGLTALFFTYSRTLWIALPVGIVLWVLLSLPVRRALPLALIFILAGASLTLLPAIQARLFNHIGVGTREDLWKANLAMFQARPLTGAGWLHNHELSGFYLMEKLHSTDVFSGHAHNNIIDALGGTGAIGLFFWILWCGVAFVLAWRLRGLWGPGLFCAWIVFQINGLTQLNFWDAKVTHQMMWAMSWLLFGAAF